MERAEGPRPRGRRRRRGGRERRARRAHAPGPDDFGRGRDPVGGRRPQRHDPGDERREGHPPRRRPADRGDVARDCAEAGRPRPGERPLPRLGASRPVVAAPRRRLERRQSPMGVGAGEGLVADPPGGRRAVERAVRVGGRLPRRAAVRRRRRGGGVARRGRSGHEFPRAQARPGRRPRPGQRRRADGRAGQRTRAFGPRRHGPDHLHRGQARRGDLQRLPLSRGQPPPTVSAEIAGRRRDPRPDRRAGPAVSDREAAGAEADRPGTACRSARS